MPQKLDPSVLSRETQEIREALCKNIVGQPRAISEIVRAFDIYFAGLAASNRPLCVFLFAGPTGVGKTEVVRAFAKALLGDDSFVTKIDCAEFQHAHEVAKLIGSPPGYLGHREGTPRLAQRHIDRFQRSDKLTVNIVMFDEIEKADDAFFDLLLSILDTGKATMGDGAETDFSRTFIFMTSNIGSRETSKLIQDGIGFMTHHTERAKLDQEIYNVTKAALKKRCRPEFINRLDRMVVFHSLDIEALRKILDLELAKVQERLLDSEAAVALEATSTVREYLLAKGTDEASGARELKRVLQREIVRPLASLIGSGQLQDHDAVLADIEDGEIVFYRADRRLGTGSEPVPEVA